LGFLPMIFLAENKAGDLWYTLALTGISGIASAFIFILLVLPALFFLLERRKNIKQVKRKSKILKQKKGKA